MRKLISILLCSALLCSTVSVFAADDDITVNINGSAAEPIASPAAEPVSVEPKEEQTINPQMLSSQVVVNIKLNQQPYTIDSAAKLELYSEDGTLLDYDVLWVGGITSELTYIFDVPQYTIGEKFKLKLAEGLQCIKYYDTLLFQGQETELQTYAYINSDGNLITSNTFDLDGYPMFNKSVSINYDGVPVDLYPGARVIDGTTMVPIRKLAEHIGMEVRFDPNYNVQIVSLGSDTIYFNIDTTYTTVFGTDLNTPYPTVMIDGTVYVALRTFADAIGSNLEVTDNFTSLSINMSSSQRVQDYYNNITVNRNGITSRTNYLVWISLSEYKLRVYEGKQYQWKPIREATCAIGAPGSPTITGQYEYEYSMPRWDYGTYYVGPCLVFYGNYAIHSVFLYQNGTEYDGRVGMRLSHGCIRLKKADIDWLYNTLPLNSRIYITP